MIIPVPSDVEIVADFCNTLKKLRLCPIDSDLWRDYIFSEFGMEYTEKALAGKIVEVVLGAPSRDPG